MERGKEKSAFRGRGSKIGGLERDLTGEGGGAGDFVGGRDCRRVVGHFRGSRDTREVRGIARTNQTQR